MVNKTRQRVEQEVDCDTSKLYGPLEVAIQYLTEIKKEYPDACLDECWTGYEDMHMRFVYMRDETDEEMNTRIEREEWEVRRAIEQREKEEQRKKDQKEYNRLKNKLGYL